MNLLLISSRLRFGRQGGSVLVPATVISAPTRMRPKEADVPGPALKTLALSSWEAIIEDEEIRSIITCFLKFQVVILFQYFSRKYPDKLFGFLIQNQGKAGNIVLLSMQGCPLVIYFPFKMAADVYCNLYYTEFTCMTCSDIPIHTPYVNLHLSRIFREPCAPCYHISSSTPPAA